VHGRRENRRSLRLTIRLFESVHRALVDELEGVSPGLRASRAVYLMMLGLMHENTQSGSGLGAVPSPRPEGEPKKRVMTPEDRAFVAGLLEFGAEGP
jgi:hypothetical protein